jgi:hypothetical protein
MSSEDGKISRREALLELLRVGATGLGTAALGFWLAERSHKPVEAVVSNAKRSHTIVANPTLPEMVIVQGGEPVPFVQSALSELGGMSRFISRGDNVLVKPNIGWNRTTKQVTNTNPELLAEVVRQCLAAGAKIVTVTDVSCNELRCCF